MISIANPIYDNVFKYLVEDERVTKTLLSALLKKNVEWGGTWRMPTKQEVEELLSKCTIQYGTNGYPGYVVTATNGKSIYLPAPGYKYDSESSSIIDKVASCWTSTSYDLIVGSHSKDNDYCYVMSLNENAKIVLSDYRFYGRLIRPVKNK